MEINRIILDYDYCDSVCSTKQFISLKDNSGWESSLWFWVGRYLIVRFSDGGVSWHTEA